MATKTYNVVVNVSVSPKQVAAGTAQVKATLGSFEKQQIESQKRVNDEIAKNQNIATQRQQYHVDRFNDQQHRMKESSAKWTNDFEKHQQRQQMALKETYKRLADTGTFDKAVLRSKQQVNDLSKAIEAQTKVAKKWTADDIFGKKPTQIESALKAQSARLAEQQQVVPKFKQQMAQETQARLQQNKAFLADYNKTQATLNTSKAVLDVAPKQISSAMANIKTSAAAGKQEIAKIDKELKNLNKTTNEGTKSLGTWGQAFKGAFIGAIAGLTFSLIIGGITSIIKGIAELGINAVKMAGDFEMTRNTMALFAGSTQAAEAELESLSNAARNTPGLTLEDAEKGGARLRALGFEAGVTEKLLVGLAKQKLISGVTDEGAMQRVIVNLQQLRAGSPQVQRDIQQMILAFPSLSREINKAFGGLQNFKKELKKDPEAAIEKFAEQLSKAKSPAFGLNVALENLYDEFVRVSREFGKPILDPLTTSVKDLTKYLQENAGAVANWGQSWADVIEGYNQRPSTSKKGGKFVNGDPQWIQYDDGTVEYNQAATGTSSGNYLAPVGLKPERGNLIKIDKSGEETFAINWRDEDGNLIDMNSAKWQKEFLRDRGGVFAKEQRIGEVARYNREREGMKVSDYQKFNQLQFDMKKISEADYKRMSRYTFDDLKTIDKSDIKLNLKEAQLERYGGLLKDTGVPEPLVDYLKQFYSELKNTDWDALIAGALEAKEKAEFKAIQDAEKKRQLDISRIEAYSQTENTIIKNKYSVQQAMLDSHLRYTTKDEIDYTKNVGKLKTSQADEEYKNRKNELNQLLKLNEDDEEKQLKINAELKQLESNHSTEIKIAKIETETKLKEIERRAQEERRQARLQFNRLELQESQNKYDKLTFDLERQIEQGVGLQTASFEKLISLSNQQTNEQIRLNREALAIELQDKSLSEEQKTNLKKQSFIEEQQLTEQNRRKILEIEDRQHQQQVKQLQDLADFSKSIFISQSQYSQTLGGLLTSEGFSPERLNVFSEQGLRKSERENFVDKLQKSLDKQFTVNKLWTEYRESIDSQFEKGSKELENAQKNSDKFRIMWENANAEVAKFNVEILELDKTVPNSYLLLEKLALGAEKNAKAFDEINSELRRSRQKFETTEIDADITLQIELRKLEEGRGVEGSKSKILEYTRNIEKLQNAAKQLKLDHIIENTKAFEDSLDGINLQIQNLVNRNPQTIAGLLDEFRTTSGKQIIADYKEIERLKFEIANSPYIDYLAIEKAYLTDILALRNQETEALISINRSKSEIANQAVYSKNQADAKVLQFIASQKGITEIISDAKINTITSAYSALDNVIGKLTQKFGAFGDVLKDVLSSLIKLALNKVFLKLFGFDLSGNQANRSFSFTGGGSSGGGVGSIANSVIGNLFGGSSSGGRNIFSGSISGGGSGANALGNIAGGDILSQAFGSAKSQLLGAGTANTVKGGSGLLGLSGLGGLGALLPILGATLGASLGGKSITGNILGGVGGLLGAVGGVGVGLGLGSGLGLTALLSLSGVAAIAAPLFLLGAYFLGRNKQRRADEKLRDKAMVDALKGLDDLIDNVKFDRIDGAGALSQADQIRASYLESMGQLKDKKTRNIALKDVSRLDAKISNLKAAVDDQNLRKTRLEKLVPTFADGGSVSNFARKNFRNNPLGYQRGRGSSRSDSMMGYFPSAKQYARYSDTEFILDAETTRNIGVDNLNHLLASKGRSFANGGAVAQTATVATASNVLSSDKINLTVNLQVGLSETEFVQVIGAYITSGEGTQEILDALATLNQNQGSNKLLQGFKDFVKKQG